MKQNTDSSSFSLLPDAGAYDPIEDRLRANVRATIEAMFEEELADFLGRLRYGRGKERARGYRHGHRDRQLTGTFGTETVRVPRARIENEAGKITEWRSKALPRYRRLTKKAEALIAAVYLAGTNTRRVKRALFGLFEGAVSKDVVSRAWRKVKVDWDAWSARDLTDLAASVGYLVVDESFADARPDLSLAGTSPDNTLILRDFTQFWGLAGVNLAFIIAAPALRRRLAGTGCAHGISGPALRIGAAALQDRNWAEDLRIYLTEASLQLDRLALAAGWRQAGGTHLFRLYRTPDDPAAQAMLARARIWSRRLDCGLRLAIPASRAEWERLRQALRR